MALTRGQIVKIVIAGGGGLSVFGLMAYLSYSKAQEPNELGRRFSEFAFNVDEQELAIEERAAELRRALALSDTQYDRTLELLREYEYGDHRSRWWSDRDEFYAVFANTLDAEQKELLQDWRDNRRARRQTWRPRANRVPEPVTSSRRPSTAETSPGTSRDTQ